MQRCHAQVKNQITVIACFAERSSALRLVAGLRADVGDPFVMCDLEDIPHFIVFISEDSVLSQRPGTDAPETGEIV